MPVFGTLKPDASSLPRATALQEERVDIKMTETLTFTFEVLAKDAIAALPPSYHPPFPPYCTLAVRHHGDGPHGPFTVAELRLHARAGSHYVGFCTGAYTDNAAVADWLRDAYGARIAAADVRLTKRHFGYEAKVVKDGRAVLDGLQRMPGYISGSDVLYVQNHNLALVDGEPTVVAEEFQETIAEARRGEADFKALDLAAFGAPTLTISNHLPSTWTSGTWSYMPVRFLMDPNKHAMAGTRRVGKKEAA